NVNDALSQCGMIPQEVMIMWSGGRYTAMAIAGIGLAVAAAAPALAQQGAGGGLAGSFGDYGYAGGYSYGWPYATYGLAGYGGSGDYGYGGYRGANGAAYGAATGADYSGSGTSYGYYGWAPSYGYAGYPFDGRAHNRGFGWGAYGGLTSGHGAGDRPPDG